MFVLTPSDFRGADETDALDSSFRRFGLFSHIQIPRLRHRTQRLNEQADICRISRDHDVTIQALDGQHPTELLSVRPEITRKGAVSPNVNGLSQVTKEVKSSGLRLMVRFRD